MGNCCSATYGYGVNFGDSLLNPGMLYDMAREHNQSARRQSWEGITVDGYGYHDCINARTLGQFVGFDVINASYRGNACQFDPDRLPDETEMSSELTDFLRSANGIAFSPATFGWLLYSDCAIDGRVGSCKTEVIYGVNIFDGAEAMKYTSRVYDKIGAFNAAHTEAPKMIEVIEHDNIGRLRGEYHAATAVGFRTASTTIMSPLAITPDKLTVTDEEARLFAEFLASSMLFFHRELVGYHLVPTHDWG